MVCSFMRVVIYIAHLIYKVILLTQHLTQLSPPPHPQRADLIPDWPPPHVGKSDKAWACYPSLPPTGRGGGHPLDNHTWRSRKGGARTLI